MFNLAGFTNSFVKATKGSVNGTPRIYNIDKGIYVYGYAEINDQATSPYSRIKVHKGFFTCPPTDLEAGDLIQDQVDNNKYIVMSSKQKYCNGESVYIDSTLYFCNTNSNIYRFQEGARDAFNRVIQSTPTLVYSDVPIMSNPKNFEVTQFPDRNVEKDKLQVYIQAKFAVQPADRIVTSTGDAFIIDVIDKQSLDSSRIWICSVNKDDR